MLRVMIVDDEPLARRGLRDLLAARRDVEVVGEADCVEAARAMIEPLQPDAIFLDVRMPEADGFELITKLRDCPPVVFVTAYSEYAVLAFEVQAVDYLLKPVRPARLGQAVRRLQAVLGASDSGQNPYGMSDRICLRTPEKTLVAPLGDIVTLQADKDFTRVSVADTPPLMICQSLGVYERNLTRVHSVEVSPSRGASVLLNGSASPIPLGRAALRRLRLAIPQHLSSLSGMGT